MDWILAILKRHPGHEGFRLPPLLELTGTATSGRINSPGFPCFPRPSASRSILELACACIFCIFSPRLRLRLQAPEKRLVRLFPRGKQASTSKQCIQAGLRKCLPALMQLYSRNRK